MDQLILVQVLGQIDKAPSSRVLAMLAVYGKTPDLRRRAIETLRGRPAEDFLDLLVGLMIDPYKYEVKPVAGPGSPGVLFVEGEKFNVSRFYAPASGTEHHAATRRYRFLRPKRHASNLTSRGDHQFHAAGGPGLEDFGERNGQPRN